MPLAPPPQTFVRRHRRVVRYFASGGEHRLELSDQRSIDSTVNSHFNAEFPRALYNREVGRSIHQDFESRIHSSNADMWTAHWMGTIFGVDEDLRHVYRAQLLGRISLVESEAPDRDLMELPNTNDF